MPRDLRRAASATLSSNAFFEAQCAPAVISVDDSELRKKGLSEAKLWKRKPSVRRTSFTRQKSNLDTDITPLPLEEAATVVWERLHKKTTPRGVVGGGSDPHEVFRSLDRTSCGRLTPEEIVEVLAQIGLKSSTQFVEAVVRCEDASETENQAASTLVDYVDFVELLKARRPRPFGVVRSVLSGLVLEVGSEWGGGDEAARSVYLMPEAKKGKPDNQQWRLTADGFLECKDRQAKSAASCSGEQLRTASPVVSLDETLDADSRTEVVVDLESDGSGGGGSFQPRVSAAALQPLVLGIEGLLEGANLGPKDFVVASRRQPAGAKSRRAQRWQLNETTGEVFSLENGMYLTVKGGVKTMDAKLWVNKCKGTLAQKWRFEPSVPEEEPAPSGGTEVEDEADEEVKATSEDSHNPLMGSRF